LHAFLLSVAKIQDLRLNQAFRCKFTKITNPSIQQI